MDFGKKTHTLKNLLGVVTFKEYILWVAVFLKNYIGYVQNSKLGKTANSSKIRAFNIY